MRTGNIIFGVLTGIGAGLVIGMLFSPEKGKENRRKISQKGEQYLSSIKKKFAEFMEGVTNRFEEAKEIGTDIVQKGKADAEHTVAEMKPIRS